MIRGATLTSTVRRVRRIRRGAGVFGEDMGAYPRRDGTVIGPSVGISEVETGCFD